MSNRIKIGEIKPKGWLETELKENMSGCIGHLDELLPELLVDHDIYGDDRLKGGDKLRKLGRNDNAAPEMQEENKEQFYWWNSESQSNWRDGYVRSAIMLEDQTYIKQTKAYLEKIFSTQENGYLGIYDEKLRFRCTGENGELWAQSSLFRGLLACYEGFQDESILDRICMAADCIMKGYPQEQSHPFDVHEPFAGVGHGLTIVDSFEWLYEITENRAYLEYAVWLYEEYSAYMQSECDIQIPNIRQPFYIFKGHAVHTFEHIRALIIAALEKEEYQILLDQLMQKLPYYLTPSGAPIGDEWIAGRTADATWTGYEFCTLQEMLHTYERMAVKTGDVVWNEQIEWLYFNAAEGMKHPTDSSIMYLKTDNCYTADGYKNPDDKKQDWNPRYKYSPTHQDAAVCCVPNSGRITPYYIQSLLHIVEDGYLAAGYGPYVYQGSYDHVPVRIEQTTSYPLDLHTIFYIKTAKPVRFSLHLRLPGWAKQMTVNGKVYENTSAICREIVLDQEWKDEQIEINFEADIRFRTDFQHRTYLTCGPLLYCLELPAKEEVTKEMRVPGFTEKEYHPLNRTLEELAIAREDWPEFKVVSDKEAHRWGELRITGIFTDGQEKKQIDMVPMARTILRKITFLQKR